MQSTLTIFRHTMEPMSDDRLKVITLQESTNLSRPTATTERYTFIAKSDVQFVEMSWGDIRDEYSPWTGVKTAVLIALMLILFVVYIVVRTRCSPACRHDVYVRLRRAVRSVA